MAKPASDRRFTDDIARIYESYLVPLIFEPYAADLAARASALNPRDLLEVACGTGVVTRALATTLQAACSITATDLNPAMVAVGQQIGSRRPVTWKQADVLALPFSDGAFDVVVCQFGVMFFPDRVRAYRRIRRVLRPGGVFLFNVWNGIDDNVFADVVTQAVGVAFPADPPQFLARTPHGHGSPVTIRADLMAAGFPTCVLEQRDAISIAATPDEVAIAYCQGTPLRDEIEAREPGSLERITATATDAVRKRFGDGPVSGWTSAVVVAAS